MGVVVVGVPDSPRLLRGREEWRKVPSRRWGSLCLKGGGSARRGFSEPGVEGRPSRAPCIQLGWGREWTWLSHLEMGKKLVSIQK